jgi:DNA invertase Pin-like site-specific DNA recombinase
MRNTSNDPRKAVAYLRVSTEEQGRDGIGLDGQRAAIDSYASQLGIEIVGCYSEARSGMGDVLKKNAGLRDALDHALRLKVPIIVSGLDRLARDSASIERIAKDYPVQLISTRDGTMDKVTLQSSAARAQREGELISERTREALRLKKAAGVTLGNPTNLPEAQKLGAAANIDRAERKAREIAAALTEAGADGTWTANAVVEMLNGLGLLTSRGGLWTISSIRRPLTRAREMLEAVRLEHLGKNPNFGRF